MYKKIEKKQKKRVSLVTTGLPQTFYHVQLCVRSVQPCYVRKRCGSEKSLNSTDYLPYEAFALLCTSHLTRRNAEVFATRLKIPLS